MSPGERLRVTIMWRVLGPLIVKAKGYLAWSLLGMGEDLPRDVFYQWRHWCQWPRYVFDDPGLGERWLNELPYRTRPLPQGTGRSGGRQSANHRVSGQLQRGLQAPTSSLWACALAIQQALLRPTAANGLSDCCAGHTNTRTIRSPSAKRPSSCTSVRRPSAGPSIRSDRPVDEIAVRCGFPTLSNFHEQFTRRTGESPRRYRNRTAAQGLPDAGNPGAAR